MKLAPQSREILRQYKALINARQAGWQASGPEGACQPARKPGQAAPAGEKLCRASGAAYSPLRCQSLLPGNARIIRDIFL
ncbi:hypothetical protein PS667_004290 [Salmonella enterica]|nr:hypothetical protein [Salmonella enterica]